MPKESLIQQYLIRADILLCGHFHALIRKDFPQGKTFLALPAWDQTRIYAVWAKDGLQLQEFSG